MLKQVSLNSGQKNLFTSTLSAAPMQLMLEDNEFNTKCLLLKLYGDVSAIKKKRIPMEMEDIGRSENKSTTHFGRR